MSQRAFDPWAEKETYDKGLTENSRKLAFAAAAICWFFRGDDVTFPVVILLSLTAVILFFAFDLAQYYAGSLIHGRLARQAEVEDWAGVPREERRKRYDRNPIAEKRPGDDYWPLFWRNAKLISLVASFFFLILEFGRQMFIT